ncbi:hypothetical protein LEP1GSC202_2542 [Leptospira yanagawae serovar Saopaulo str. Sao Paulo = ATCC 700523]|uniref:Uncharacterized protein n=1 Tax=Leptospira yanagawae serovar Saopaulo str. Sao Paulo = ATCC 700523 TaxID=1249483 RepID=A0A5E8H8Z3_9LEPT|nr:hypothetical protein [Leptospira yanagawae]EOQ87130.1 hypothetical protein LEP1GSC202_2542 [Leptospira yanagawae serovar Saopaulo str. Sao Paulo = ATCC 700523]
MQTNVSLSQLIAYDSLIPLRNRIKMRVAVAFILHSEEFYTISK